MKRCKAMAAVGAALFVAAQAMAQEPIWEANSVELETETLGGGAYALVPGDADEKAPAGIPVATSSGFVVGDRAALIVDTGINARVFGQISDAVQTEAPGRMLFAVNTSYHGDHSYGNVLLPEDAVIIQHAATQVYLEANFDQDVAFMLGLFGEGRGIEDARYRPADILVPPNGSIALDLGGVEVEVRDFGFAQTGGDLMIWVPDAGVLYAGNPVIAEAPSLPWLLDGRAQETRDTMAAIRDFLPADATIVPGHGRPVGVETLDWYIDYLDALLTEADAAVAAGQSVEDLAASDAFTEFSGYAIFDWVHRGVNVPAAFKEVGDD